MAGLTNVPDILNQPIGSAADATVTPSELASITAFGGLVTGQAGGSVASPIGVVPSTGDGSTAAPAGSPAPQASCSGGIFNWSCWSAVASDAAFVAIGVMIIVLAVAAGVFGEGARKQLVMVTKK